MNTIVDFETAKLLKEKGFDENCYRTYINGEISPFPLLENMGGEPILNPLDYKWKNSLIHHSVITAPTIAEVVMWLFSKHNIWISVAYAYDDTFFYDISECEDIPMEELTTDEFTNPTEAYISAINYCLTNLI